MFIFEEIRSLIYCCIFRARFFLRAYFIGLVYLVKEWYSTLFVLKKEFRYLGLRSETRYAVLTGASQGIGLEVAEQLLENGITLTIGALLKDEDCRNLENTFMSKFPQSKVSIWPLNLKSMKSVRNFSERYIQSSRPLHLLLNNAGVMYVNYEETLDGFEHHLAVNYLSHCLLTKLLLPLLIDSGKADAYSRIINTASSVHYVGDINFEDLQSRDYYSPYFCYLQSKLAIVMFTSCLQSHLQNRGYHVTANCLHPGVVYTNLYKHVFWASYVGPYLFKKPKEGAQTVLYCALSPEVEAKGGRYFEECEIVKQSAKALDQEKQKRLWSVTWDLLDKWIHD